MDSARLQFESDRPTVVIPVLNDWDALRRVLLMLDGELAAAGQLANVLVVDDGSTVPAPRDLFAELGTAVCDVRVLHLRRNLGHQRAIAIGLTCAFEQTDATEFVVMDGDGEDAPSDVPRLLAALREAGPNTVVFAARSKRSEGATFRMFYALFRLVHWLLIGRVPRVGNFSALTRGVLERLVVTSDMWNHYAATVYRSRVDIRTIPTARAKRLCDGPGMSFVALVVHGLSALAVYGDVVGVRSLIATGVLILTSMLAVVVALGVELLTPFAVPRWATVGVGVAVLVCVQAMSLAFVLCLSILGARDRLGFIPIRDYAYFVRDVTTGAAEQ